MSDRKNYGTNNRQAYEAGECPDEHSPDTTHGWIYYRTVGRSYTQYICKYCSALCAIDSNG